MEKGKCWLAGMALVLVGLSLPGLAQVPETINYQGRLIQSTNLVNGVIGLSLRLYDAASGGTLLYEDSNAVAVVDGLYATTIGDNTTQGSLAAALAYTDIYLEAAVDDMAFAPREKLASAGFSLATRGWKVSTDIPPSLAGNAPYNTVAAGSLGSTIGGGAANTGGVSGSYMTIGGGINNQALDSSLFGGATVGGGMNNKADGPCAVVGGGFQNVATNSSTTVAGGNNNKARATYAAVGGGHENSADSEAATVAGGRHNIIPEFTEYATIGGGASNFFGPGAFNPDYGVIAGGKRNSIEGASIAFIGGGNLNAIRSGAQQGVIGGGRQNTIDAGSATCSGILGGEGNTIGPAGIYSVIGGGYHNQVNAGYACVLYGDQNSATGVYSFAAGLFAHADDQGSLVWGDSQNSPVHSWGPDTVAFRCNGGVKFQDATGAQYAQWIPGAANWTVVSDRNQKENFAPVNARALADKVGRLPLTEWNYKGYGQRHIGPMAQDFQAAFALNPNTQAIDSGDLQGVTLAAVQGLYQMIQDLQTENRRLRQRLDAMEAVR